MAEEAKATAAPKAKAKVRIFMMRLLKKLGRPGIPGESRDEGRLFLVFRLCRSRRQSRQQSLRQNGILGKLFRQFTRRASGRGGTFSGGLGYGWIIRPITTPF
jgi:hypothetical protein